MSEDSPKFKYGVLGAGRQGTASMAGFIVRGQVRKGVVPQETALAASDMVAAFRLRGFSITENFEAIV